MINSTEKDREKWKQLPFKLLIVKKQDINNLELWFKNNLNAIGTRAAE